jgi:DNA-binding MltR family transcriptional regulator
MIERPPKPEGQPASPRFKKRSKDKDTSKSRDEWLNDVTPILQELQGQTHRGAAIIAGSFLDKLLELVIERRLLALSGEEISENQRKALFGRMAPLSTFSAKIEIGFGIGLFNASAYSNFEMIRDVRNKFAHQLAAIDFDHPEIAEIVNNPSRSPVIRDGGPPRDEFLLAFALLAGMLYAERTSDIRIHPLSETHPDIFSSVIELVRTIQASVVQKRQPDPHADTGDTKA